MIKLSKVCLFLLICLLITNCEKEIKPEEINNNPETNQSELKAGKVYPGYWYNNKYDGVHAFSFYRPVSAVGRNALVIAIHGGGFISGQKLDMIPNPKLYINGVYVTSIDDLENTQISYVSINYSLLNDDPLNDISKPLNDCQNALDYFKANADFLRIDTNKIFLLGYSAGASTSLWLGLKNNNNIKGIICYDPQASLDKTKWRNEIFAPYNLGSFYDNKIPEYEDLFYKLYKTSDSIEIQNNSNKYKWHLLDLIDNNDPKIFLVNTALPNDFLHNLAHVRTIEKIANQRGLETNVIYVRYNTFKSTTAEEESVIEFFKRNLND